MAKLSSLDATYSTGLLSVYPTAIDTRSSLYDCINNSETKLSQTLSYNATFITVDSTSSFSDVGLLKIGEEIIYYTSKTPTIFLNLTRGFAGSRRGIWKIGESVLGSVFAEHHNSLKDAILNIEANVGIQTNPVTTSLNGLLIQCENIWLAPRPLFRALPTTGPAPLQVTFHNFSGSDPLRFLWDFGDGSTSNDVNPIHTYVADGSYDVTLNLLTTTGAIGIVKKSSYVIVNSTKSQPYFYVTPTSGTISTSFTFVDQTIGKIQSRYWLFGNGISVSISDANNHTYSYTYPIAGTYTPELLVVFSDSSVQKINLPNPIIVS